MRTDSFGSARWADFEDMGQELIHVLPWFEPYAKTAFANIEAKYKLYSEQDTLRRSFILGRVANPGAVLNRLHGTNANNRHYNPILTGLLQGLTKVARQYPDHYLGWNGDGHLITMAPTRAGKGVGLVIPNLLSYPGSVIVVDPKGENYSLTADYRSRHLGQKVVCLDPFNVVSGKKRPDVLNPMDVMGQHLDPTFGDNAAMLAEAMVIRSPDQKDPHWDEKASTLIKAMIMAVAAGRDSRRHLGVVRQLLTKNENDWAGFLDSMERQTQLAHGLVARAASEFKAMGVSERSSVLSSAQRHTEFLDSPLVSGCLSDPNNQDKSSYNMATLKHQGQVSVYLILPPHYMNRYSRLIRLWLTVAFHAVTSVSRPPIDGCPVLFMLDEMAQLGRMEQLIQAVSLLAGYGLTMWMVWQDMGQLKSLYPKEWPSFLANAKVQQFFGTNDAETAKYVSEQLGSATVEVISSNESDSVNNPDLMGIINLQGGSKGRSQGSSKSEKERRLLTVDEVRRLDRETVIMLVQGCPPILSRRISYYAEKFNQRIRRS